MCLCVSVFVCVCVGACVIRHVCFPDEYARLLVQGGEDPWDAFSCKSIFAKESLIIGLFCRK